MIKLNKRQQEAADFREGAALVIAGPGSGKTASVTARIAKLIDGGIREEQILAISFTDAAASEMKSRFLKYMQADRTSVTFGTFHSVFYSCLRRYFKDTVIRVPERKVCTSIMKEVIRKQMPAESAGSDYISLLIKDISRVKNGMSPGYPETRTFIQPYNKALHAEGYMDFDDMVLMMLKLLRSDSAVLNDMRQRYSYLIVDEFQDINRVQFEALRLIASPLNNLMAVGDDDQSIYAFRGSDPGIMLAFERYYPGSARIVLNVNYRSGRKIVDASKRLIAHNKKRLKKDMVPGAAMDALLDIRGFGDEAEEAAALCKSLSGKEAGLSCAVLSRTHKAAGTAAAVAAETGSAGTHAEFMTFHASKGREFDEIYIIGANEGTTPAPFSSDMELCEERRMFYVAMTRARKKLHIFYTKGSYNEHHKASRFIRESISLKHWLSIRG